MVRIQILDALTVCLLSVDLVFKKPCSYGIFSCLCSLDLNSYEDAVVLSAACIRKKGCFELRICRYSDLGLLSIISCVEDLGELALACIVTITYRHVKCEVRIACSSEVTCVRR